MANKAPLLYYFDACPYCQKVLRYLEDRHIQILKKDIWQDADAKNELRYIGTKTQVPCLIIDDQAMYESDDIIAWFEHNWVEQ